MIKPVHIEATTLPDAWFQLIDQTIQHGKKFMVQRGSYENQSTRLQLDFVTARIKFPGTRSLIPEIPPGLNIPTPTDMEYVENQYLPYLMEDSIQQNEEYSYGTDIKPQLQPVIDMLRDTPGTNQACMNIGRAESILLPDPQCLRILSFKVIENKLNCTVFFRSNDLFNAWSANLAGIQLLKEYIAMMSEKEDGEIFYVSDGLHLYDFSEDLAKLRVGE